MIIIAYFTENGIPKTGLSATVSAANVLTDTLVLTAQALTELTSLPGHYFYNWTAMDDTLNLAFTFDGSATLSGTERYQPAWHILRDIRTKLEKALGMAQHNFRMFNPVYDSESNLLSATFKIYPTAADTDADTNAITSYSMVSTFSGVENLTYKMTED